MDILCPSFDPDSVFCLSHLRHFLYSVTAAAMYVCIPPHMLLVTPHHYSVSWLCICSQPPCGVLSDFFLICCQIFYRVVHFFFQQFFIALVHISSHTFIAFSQKSLCRWCGFKHSPYSIHLPASSAKEICISYRLCNFFLKAKPRWVVHTLVTTFSLLIHFHQLINGLIWRGLLCLNLPAFFF